MKNVNYKKLIRLGSIVAVVALIFLATMINMVLDPENFDLKSFVANSCIMIFISIFGILTGEAVGSERLRENPNGIFQNALKEFNTALLSIEVIKIYFSDFLLWYAHKESKIAQTNYLISNKVLEAKDIVEDTGIIDYEKLLQQPIKLENGTIVRRKDKDQIKAIKDVKSGKINVEANSPTYYFDAFTKVKTTSELTFGKKIDHEISGNKFISRTFKIVTSIAFSFIWASLTIQDYSNLGNVTAWVNLISRLSTLLTSMSSGWGTSVVDNRLQTQKIKNKTNIIQKFKTFYDTKEYTPVDYKNLALQEYEAFENKLKEEKEDESNN